MKIRIKFSAKKIIKYSKILVYLLSIALIIYTAVYLYNNFYLVITQTEDIVLSNENLSIDTINIKKFDAVIKNIENKTNPSPYQNLKNIFQ